jgi:hypothetical protein
MEPFLRSGYIVGYSEVAPWISTRKSASVYESICFTWMKNAQSIILENSARSRSQGRNAD